MRKGAARRGQASTTPRLFTGVLDDWATDDYLTPRWLFDALSLSFDVDPAAPPGGVPWVPAAESYDVEANGLAQDWHGRVWLNPPYSECAPWVRRFISHGHGVAILPHSRSRWHHDLWRSSAALADVLDISGSLFRFWRDGALVNVYVPVFLAAFGSECVEAIARCGTVRIAA